MPNGASVKDEVESEGESLLDTQGAAEMDEMDEMDDEVPNVPCGSDGRGLMRSCAQFFCEEECEEEPFSEEDSDEYIPEEDSEQESVAEEEDFAALLAACGRSAQKKACGKASDAGAALKLPDEAMPEFFGFPLVPTPSKKRPASWRAFVKVP